MVDDFIEKIKTIGIIVKNKEKLPYGSGSKGRYIPSEETGGMPILIPSWGSMEKEEIDYVAEASIEKEQARVKRKSAQKERLEQVVTLARQAPPGERAKVAREAIRKLS